MFRIEYKNRFKKDLKLLKKRSVSDFYYLQDFIKKLQKIGCKGIPAKNRPHMLAGRFNGYCETHVKPDLLLIWKEDIEANEIVLIRTGSHSDLFK